MQEHARLSSPFSLVVAASVWPIIAAAQVPADLTWHFEQIYSNPDGYAQFAAVSEYGNNQDQNLLKGSSLTSTHNSAEHAHDPGYVSTFVFPNDLPSSQTSGRRFLIGTQAFADLNIIAPDYIIDNQFIPQQAGYMNLFRTYSIMYDVVGYNSLPNNGVDALFRDGTARQNYTPFATEYSTVKLNPNWQFESVAFYMQLADANGNCASGTIPLYRLYNNGMGGAPNHRYTTSLTTLDQMVAAGWVFEGNGNTKVFACLPQ